MEAPLPLDVHVRLERMPDADYRAHVRTPEGSGAAIFAVPDEDLSLEPVNAWLSGKLEIKRSTGRGPRDRAVDIGRSLFRALFTGSLHALYERTARNRAGLRVRIDADDLAACTLPWELLYDDVVRQDFLALGTDSAVLRTYYAQPGGTGLAPATPPLRVLVVTADEQDALRVDEDVELFQRLATTRPHVELDVLEHATTAALVERLRDGPAFDVLHLAGTGTAVGQGRAARQVLLMEGGADPEPGEERLSAKVLGEALEGHDETRLVLLAACFSDEIAAHVSRTVPAVVGIRGEMTVDACRAFLDAFYRAALDGAAVEAATWQARSALETTFPGRREWASAVLYLTGTGPLVEDVHALPGMAVTARDPRPGAPADDAGVDDLEHRRRVLSEQNLAVLTQRVDELGEAAPQIMRDERDRLRREIGVPP